MPALPDVPQVCKLIISGVYHDAKWINIWYVHYSGTAPSASNIDAYLTAQATALGANYTAEMSVDNEVTGWEMTDLTSATSARGAITFSAFGARTGDFTPASSALVLSCEISRRYRGGHPRKYLPFGTAGTYASGSTTQWDSSFLADVQTKMEAFVAGLVGVTEGGTTWDDVVNVSYRTGGAVRATAVVDPITSVLARSRICTQRRRLGRIGA